MKILKSTLSVLILLSSSLGFSETQASGKLTAYARIGKSVLYCGPGGIMVTAGAAIGTVVGGAAYGTTALYISASDIIKGQLPKVKDFDEYKDFLTEGPNAIKSIWHSCYKVSVRGEDPATK